MAGRTKTRRTGQGSVYQRKDGRWECAITHGYNEKGNPLRHRSVAPTRKEVEDKLREIIVNLGIGRPAKDSKQTLANYLSDWLEQTVKPHKEPKTYRYYEQMVRLYIVPTLGNLKLADVSHMKIQAMLNQRAKAGLAPRTVQAIRATLRRALNLAVKQKLIGSNPAEFTDTPKNRQKSASFLDLDEMQKLIKVCSTDYVGGLIVLGLNTGLRVGEATGVSWSDIDLDLGILQVRNQLQRVNKVFLLKGLKTNSSRRNLSLSDNVIKALRQQKANQVLWASSSKVKPFNPLGLVFTTTDGRPLDPKLVDKHLKSLCDTAKVKQVSFHKLRHSVATQLASNGVSLSIIKDQLGHSQISLTVDTYGHSVPSALRQASDTLDTLLESEPKNQDRPA